MDVVYRDFPQLVLELIGISANKQQIPTRPYLRLHDQLDDQQYLKTTSILQFRDSIVRRWRQQQQPFRDLSLWTSLNCDKAAKCQRLS